MYLSFTRTFKSKISEIPHGWDPHKEWEFIKTMIRTLAWEEAGKNKKSKGVEEDALRAQINRLHENRRRSLEAGACAVDINIINIDRCIKDLESDLHKIWIEKSKKLAFKAKVKWFDEGKNLINTF